MGKIQIPFYHIYPFYALKKGTYLFMYENVHIFEFSKAKSNVKIQESKCLIHLWLTCALLPHVSNLGFNPMWFAQSSPLLTYVLGQKGRHHVFTWKLLFWGAVFLMLGQ